MAEKKKFYAVFRGRKPGIYRTWSGAHGAETQIRGCPGARYKGFSTLAEAEAWLHQDGVAADPVAEDSTAHSDPAAAQIYTDGACSGNPGPGGYGVIIKTGKPRQEMVRSGGYRHTTNNRMELIACIRGLEEIEPGIPAVIHTDSSYVANGMTKGWAARWRSRGWLKSDGKPAENIDLWKRLLNLCEHIEVRFHWIRGHAGHPENERCDKLAVKAAAAADLPEDPGYRSNATK